jgi:hypothetical protein
MAERFGMEVKRYVEHPVTLTHVSGDRLTGVKFWEYPVDVPPLVDAPSVGRLLYAEVWERMGWLIADVEPE